MTKCNECELDKPSNEMHGLFICEECHFASLPEFKAKLALLSAEERLDLVEEAAIRILPYYEANVIKVQFREIRKSIDEVRLHMKY